MSWAAAANGMDLLSHLAPQDGTWARYSMLNGAEPVNIWAGESTRHAVALTSLGVAKAKLSRQFLPTSC